MLELITLPYLQRALAAGLLVAVLSSFFGAFVVQRGLSFLGSGLAHAAFGGVALGLLLQQEPLYFAIPFTIAVAIGIIYIQERTRLSADTSIGILFSVALALGVIFLSQTSQFTTDAYAYLFGDILAVSRADLAVTALVAVALLACIPLWGRWAAATFDRELALAAGMPVRRDDYLLFIALSVVIVVSLKVVGITLVAAFLVIPAAAARLVAQTFSGMTLLSVLISAFSVVLGMGLSWELDMPSGPVIILAQAVLFLLAMAWPARA